MARDNRFGFSDASDQHPEGHHAYYVRTMRGSIGYVQSYKIYGERGWWGAYRFDGEQVGARHPTRLAAAIALHERAQRGER